MTEKLDVRTLAVVTPPLKTSLSAFLTKTTEASDDTGSDVGKGDTDISTETITEANGLAEGNEVTPEGSSKESDEKTFEVKGKQVPLKDLLNAFETREEISRRFGELGTREQRLKVDADRIKVEKEEIRFINEKFEEMREEVLAGNSLGALQIAAIMAESTGDNPSTQTAALIKQAITIAENFHAMSEAEQQTFLKEEALKYKEKVIAKKEAAQKKLDDEAELRVFYDTVLDANKVTDEELDVAFEHIQTLPKFKEDLEKKTPKERISYCTSWVLGQRLNKVIETGISKVDKKLAEDQSFRIAILDVVDPRCTVEDVEAIVRHYKGEASNNGSAQVETEASTQSVVEKTTTSNRAPPEKARAETNVPIHSWKDLIAKHSV